MRAVTAQSTKPTDCTCICFIVLNNCTFWLKVLHKTGSKFQVSLLGNFKCELATKVAEMDTVVGRGAQVLEDEAPMEEEDVVGIGVEGGAQWRGGIEGSFGSLLKGSIYKQFALFLENKSLNT